VKRQTAHAANNNPIFPAQFRSGSRHQDMQVTIVCASLITQPSSDNAVYLGTRRPVAGGRHREYAGE